MKHVIINLYLLSELSETAKTFAIEEHKDFLDNEPTICENEIGEMVEEYINHSENDVIESIEINEYLFFASGEMANVTTYTGNHLKKGTSELKFKGEIYKL